MTKQEIIEKKQNEFNDYSMEFTNKIEHELSMGFKPEQVDKYLRKDYSPILRDAIRFAMLFNPNSKGLDKLIEILTTQKITTLDFRKLFKAYIIDDPDDLFEDFMEATKKFEVTKENSESNLKKLKREMKRYKYVEIKMPEGLDIMKYIIDRFAKNKITSDQMEMLTKGIMYGISNEMIYESIERNTSPIGMRQVFALEITKKCVDKWKL